MTGREVFVPTDLSTPLAPDAEITVSLQAEHIPMEWKLAVWAAGGYCPFGAQIAFHRSIAGHRFFGGGNRSGKTEAAVWEVLPYLFWPDTSGWVVGAVYALTDTIRDKLLEYLEKKFGHRRVYRRKALGVGDFWYGEKARELRLWTGSTVRFKSGDIPETLHAEALDYVIIDEAAQFPYEHYEKLVARLADADRFGWISSHSTFEFQRGQWFEDYFNLGQAPNKVGVESFRHPTTLAALHGYVKVGWLYAQWVRLVAIGQEELFNARYMGIPRPTYNRVFPRFSVLTHVCSKKAEYRPHSPVWLTVDPGTAGTYAVAVLQIQQDEGELVRIAVIDEIYLQETATTIEVADICKTRPWWPDVGVFAYPGAIDIAATESRGIWAVQYGLSFRTKKVGIRAGVELLARWINEPARFYVHPRCRWTIYELTKWSYPPTRDPFERDPRGRAPRNEWNHIAKALYYWLACEFGFWEKRKRKPQRKRRIARTPYGGGMGQSVPMPEVTVR